MAEQRVVITKDKDFYNAYLLQGVPYKILMITTGNISNNTLLSLLEQNFTQIRAVLQENNVVEMNNNSILVHF
jgi:predicted nuclease of predicted toxin-antitoxin system